MSIISIIIIYRAFIVSSERIRVVQAIHYAIPLH